MRATRCTALTAGARSPPELSPAARELLSPAKLEGLLEELQRASGVDLRGYKRASLRRRLRLCMAEARTNTVAKYRARLAHDPREREHLLQRVFICYSHFNRDPAVFRHIDRVLLPELLAGQRTRIWCAGCAGGEEAYSLALLIAGHCPLDDHRVRIFATDIHQPAVEQARAAIYPQLSLGHVPAVQLERHSTAAGGRRRMDGALRRAIVFARHDLARDPPIGKIDLLLCRYVLIYFDKVLQQRVWSSLMYAVRPGGYLVLGSAEMPPTAARPRLQVVDRGLRIFRRRPDPPIMTCTERSGQAGRAEDERG